MLMARRPAVTISPSHRRLDNASPRSSGQPNATAPAARTMSETGAPPVGDEEIVYPKPSLTCAQGNSDPATIAIAPPHKPQPVADGRSCVTHDGRAGPLEDGGA